MLARKVDVEMPPVDCGQHLLGYLYEFGPAMAGGMGAVPVTFAEMAAWQLATGVDLEPWEARLLRRLSADYVAESHKASKTDCPPPWGESAPLRASQGRAAARALELFLA
ncbi:MULTISPECIES: hypothetical protein [unclassified Janthinobacterium]|uniref:hypothetical protein n=1 Tax=unclassified Janthinobacterium TaxID=2610881 RepID=UPI0018CAC74B|nr:hypothetical protein [Janthinobacterium sp. CG_23.4]MDH6157438.1 hypothetical protein [Janthinobacterium sp. CG_23.4]